MKIIFVFGDDDFGAQTFEQDLGGPSNVAALFEEQDVPFEDGKEIYIEEAGVTIMVHEFDAVDPKFIMFIRDEIQDYDQRLHSEFYVIE